MSIKQEVPLSSANAAQLYSTLVLADRSQLVMHYQARHGGTMPRAFKSRSAIIIDVMEVAFPNLGDDMWRHLIEEYGEPYVLDTRKIAKKIEGGDGHCQSKTGIPGYMEWLSKDDGPTHPVDKSDLVTVEFPREFDDEDGGSNDDPDEESDDDGKCYCTACVDEVDDKPDPNDIEKSESFEPNSFDVRLYEVSDGTGGNYYVLNLITRGPRDYVKSKLRSVDEMVANLPDYFTNCGGILNRQLDHKCLDDGLVFLSVNMAGRPTSLSGVLDTLQEEI